MEGWEVIQGHFITWESNLRKGGAILEILKGFQPLELTSVFLFFSGGGEEEDLFRNLC